MELWSYRIKGVVASVSYLLRAHCGLASRASRGKVQFDAYSMSQEATGVIDLTKGIDSLTNFKRNTLAFIDRLQESGQPVVLTVNGKAKLVVQDAASYQQLLDMIDQLDAVEGTRRGLEEMKAGLGKPLESVDKENRKKHRIPRDA
jgi:prevent-host-death family protein